jgi:hypothetical protein
VSYKFMANIYPDYWADSGGLKFRKFNIYPVSVPGSDVTPSPNPYGLSGSAWTTGIEGSNTTISRTLYDSNVTYVWRGYFRPDQSSSSWQFRTRSNDGSWLWVDSEAEASTTALVTNNADVKNGGIHTAQTVTSANINLTQSADGNTYYAIAIVAGNSPGSGTITVEFRRDGGDWQSDGTGFYFYDSRRSDGFDPNS